MDRREFIKELRTKKYVRESLRAHWEEQKEKEEKLRGTIRKLIKEAKATDIPYQNTGINVLHDVMKKIVPIIREDYKDLTTSKRQRKEFRKHIINAVKQSILPIQNFHKAAEQLRKSDEEIEEDAEERMIDVDDGSEGGSNQSNDEERAEELVGGNEDALDSTGRNMAIKTFARIESNILDGYELLANEEDRELFFEYLIDNLKLYFNRWEDELRGETSTGIDLDQDIPDEMLQEIATTRPDVRRKKIKNKDQWTGWHAFKESAKVALHEDGYKKFMDLSEEELKQKLQNLRKQFENAEGEEIDELEYKIGSALVALWAKLGNLD